MVQMVCFRRTMLTSENDCEKHETILRRPDLEKIERNSSDRRRRTEAIATVIENKCVKSIKSRNTLTTAKYSSFKT